MRSKPRLNGSRLPVRLTAPSAKMQTTWPASSSARARSIDATTSRLLPAVTGIARIAGSNQRITGSAEVRPVDHEADEALHAGADEHAVDIDT